ncbi:13185_t:CDS:1, partial [Ambispora gerdemannii]
FVLLSNGFRPTIYDSILLGNNEADIIEIFAVMDYSTCLKLCEFHVVKSHAMDYSIS